MDVAPNKIGMLMKQIQLCFGKAKCASLTSAGAMAPPRKNQLTFIYSPRFPKILRGPTRPQITDASKNTRSIGQVHGLSCGSLDVSQRLGMSPISHQAVPRYTITATIVPTTCNSTSLAIEDCNPTPCNADLINSENQTDLSCEHCSWRNLHVVSKLKIS